MPFFFLCLLEDSSPLSNSGFGFFFLLGSAAWAAGCGLDSMSLTAFGASEGFSAAGNGVAFTGPTAFRPPLGGRAGGCAGVPTLAPWVRISTPMVFPVAAGAAVVVLGSLVTADVPVGAPAAPAAGTS